MYKVSDDTRVGQAIVMFFTFAMFLFTIPFYYFSDNVILVAVVFICLIFFNWIASRNHYIYIKEGNFYIESLYAKTRIIEATLFSKVDVVIPGQSYYYLYFTNGHRYTFSKRGHLKLLFKQGEKGIIKKMTDEIQIELTKKILI